MGAKPTWRDEEVRGAAVERMIGSGWVIVGVVGGGDCGGVM